MAARARGHRGTEIYPEVGAGLRLEAGSATVVRDGTAIDELIGQWQEFIKGFGATQHLTGPLSVAGDRIETHVTAHHWRPGTGNAWVVHGHYIARITDGKISELTLQTFHASGDPALPSIPAQRP
jgi:hypothetical protein